MRHTTKSLLGDELAGDAANSVGLVVNAHKGGLQVVDELALPLGKMRLKGSGSNGGHNGLGHIQQLIGQNYARLRMGIGSEFQRGGQIDYVLGRFSPEEREILDPVIENAVECVKSFVLAGIDITMNQFNKK